MAVLDSLKEFFVGAYTGTPIFGICKGAAGGHLGVWGKWSAKDKVEVYRVAIRYSGKKVSGASIEGAFTYTFGPSLDKPFWQSLEMPYPMKEFLVGKNPAKQGSITVEFYSSLEAVRTQTYPLDVVLECYRQRGISVPEFVNPEETVLSVDTLELAGIQTKDLKAYSDRVRSELEEKRKKAEEERKAKEEAAKAAAKKAQEAASKPAAAAGGAPVDRTKPTLQPGKTILVYGSSTGNTANVAEAIKKEISEIDHVKNITDIHPVDMTLFQNIILGIPTWHIGELQDDWAAVMSEINALNFAGKKVAVFGLGDQKGYADTYVDAMQELLEPFEKTGAKLVALWPTDGYSFKASKAIRNGKFLGLVIDVENQDNLSDKRIKSWCQQLKAEMFG